MKQGLIGQSFICFLLVVLLPLTAELAFSAEGITVAENILKLQKNNSCRGCDLSGADLTRFELSGADLEGADLSRVKFYLANLSGANLRNTNLKGAVFGGADLGNADLTGADLRGALLENAYLAGVKLDGKFVQAKPFESVGVMEIEKEVYIDDQSKPKKSPETRSVAVATRRDFEDPPPYIHEVKSAQVQKSHVPEPAKTPIPLPPVAKKLKYFNRVVVKNPPASNVTASKKRQQSTPFVKNKKSAHEAFVAKAATEKKSSLKVKSVSATSIKDEPGKQSLSPVVTQDKKKISEIDNSIGSIAKMSENLAIQKKKNDNLNRLLDKNKCYGCDLSGLDLSGQDLEDADLERADLTGCNLENVNLEGANLKGARLVRARLQRANLKAADLYKADLSEADLTDIDLQDASLDSAKMDSVTW